MCSVYILKKVLATIEFETTTNTTDHDDYDDDPKQLSTEATVWWEISKSEQQEARHAIITWTNLLPASNASRPFIHSIWKNKQQQAH